MRPFPTLLLLAGSGVWCATIILALLFVSSTAASSHFHPAERVDTATSSSSSSSSSTNVGGCMHSFTSRDQREYLLDGSDPLVDNNNNNNNNNNNAQIASDSVSSGRSAKAQALTWKALSIFTDSSRVTNPALDTDVISSLARSCTTTGGTVHAGGRNSGQFCFNQTTGKREFQNYCQLYCQANETLTAAQKTQLITTVSQAATMFRSKLEVPATDNITIAVRSDAANDCAGLSIDLTTMDNLYIALTTRPTRQLGGAVRAHAASCQRHEGSYRPILVHLNVDPTAMYDTTGTVNIYDQVVHQLFHAFGFSNKSYPLFRHPDDTQRRSYYQYNPTSYPTGPIASSSSSGVINSGNGNFRIDQAAVAAGDKIYFKGPNTIKVAQQYFGCPGGMSTNGVELENGGSSERITAVHWEKRILHGELLVGTRSPTNAHTLSFFSWALLQDTGYFNVPMLAQNFYWDTSTMKYGKGAGCAWVSGSCKDWPSTGASNSQYLCSTPNAQGCGFDNTFVGVCDLRAYGTALPAAYQYVTGQPNQGGGDSLADYCPMYQAAINGRCDVAANDMGRGVTSGMSFSSKSRCFMSKLLNTSVKSGGASFGGCFQSFCSSVTSSGFVVVGREAIPCTRDGEVVELFPPARFNVFDFKPQAAGATLFLSYTHHGMLECANLFSECQRAANKTVPVISKSLPVVTSVVPAWGDPTGGTTVTLVGTDMGSVTGAIIGGVVLSEFVSVNNSACKGKLGNVGSVYGGPGTDGVGDALVELTMRLSGGSGPTDSVVPACANGNGCVVSRTKNVFNYSLTDPNLLTSGGAGVLTGFFDSPAGKAVGVIMCVLVIVVLILIARKCFKDGQDTVDEKVVAPSSPSGVGALGAATPNHPDTMGAAADGAFTNPAAMDNSDGGGVVLDADAGIILGDGEEQELVVLI